MGKPFHLLALCLSLLGGMGAQSHAQQNLPTAKMSNNSAVVVFTFQPYGEIKLAAMVKNMGGMTAVCGIWTVSQRIQAHVKASRLPQRSRSTTTLFLGNVRIHTGMTFMDEVPEDKFAAGTVAKCYVTDRAWKPSYASVKPTLKAPRLRSLG